MTSQPTTDIPSRLEVGRQHTEKIRAAIRAAEEDGFQIAVDVEYDSYDNSQVLSVDIDLRFGLAYVDTIQNIEY